MSNPDPTPERQDQLMREAAGWFARMRGPEAEESREAFESWLRRGALHRGAYNRAAEIFAMGKMLTEEEAAKPLAAPRSRLRAAGVAAILLLLVGLVPLLTLGSESMFGPPAKTDGGSALASSMVMTGPGERRTFTLADRSRIALQGDSSVRVEFGAERRLELIRGEARFEVFHEVRPFIVHAGGGTVTARGTVFDVALGLERRVTVRLIQGSVDVKLPITSASAPSDPQLRRMRPGNFLSFAAQQPGTGKMSGKSSTVSQGRSAIVREYEAIAIAQLVEEANRASPVPIRLGDPSIGPQKVSGRFRIDDPLLLAERLAILFDLRVDRSDPDLIMLRRR